MQLTLDTPSTSTVVQAEHPKGQAVQTPLMMVKPEAQEVQTAVLPPTFSEQTKQLVRVDGQIVQLDAKVLVV